MNYTRKQENKVKNSTKERDLSHWQQNATKMYETYIKASYFSEQFFLQLNEFRESHSLADSHSFIITFQIFLPRSGVGNIQGGYPLTSFFPPQVIMGDSCETLAHWPLAAFLFILLLHFFLANPQLYNIKTSFKDFLN